MLRRLAERHELLPDRMVVTEEIEVSDEIAISGGFGDVNPGTYMGDRVAVKTARVAAQDDLQQIRKVNINCISRLIGTRSRSSCSRDFTRRSFSGGSCPIRTS